MFQGINATTTSSKSGRKYSSVLAVLSLFAALLLPFAAAQPASAASSPWNQDSLYGCIDQPIVPFEVMPGNEPGKDAFRVREGRLPEGLELDEKTGVISGTPRGIYRDIFVVSSESKPDYPTVKISALIDERCRPTVDKIDPDHGINLGGTQIDIFGTGFDERVTVAVDDAGTPIYLTDVRADKEHINAVMPAYSGSGPVTLIIRNPDGSRVSIPKAFTYESGPATPT